MKLSDNGIRLIKGFETYHRALPNGDCVAYRCPSDVPTIGWGTTKGVHDGLIWTRQQCEDAFNRDVAEFEGYVNRGITVPMNQNQFDAMVSLAYNIGNGGRDHNGKVIPGFSTSSVLKRMNAGDVEGAARAFALWNKANGAVSRGLVARRARETALFLKPVTDPVAAPVAADAPPDMPQKVDAPPEAPTGSRKWSLTQWLRRLFGGTAIGGGAAKGASDAGLDPYGMITQTATLLQAYTVELLIAACVLAFIAMEAMKLWQQQDYEEGRSVASGDVK
jgi:lysozyme